MLGLLKPWTWNSQQLPGEKAASEARRGGALTTPRRPAFGGITGIAAARAAEEPAPAAAEEDLAGHFGEEGAGGGDPTW
jgi:hypothetical protein